MRQLNASGGLRSIWRLAVLFAAAALAALLVFHHGPILQDEAYHAFADTRSWLGIPNALNVLSNLPFLAVGAMGLAFVAKHPERFAAREDRICYALFFAGALLVCFGSGAYHWRPDDATLVWDRLPMAFAFMGILCATVAERVSPRAGLALLAPLVLLGAFSVWHWKTSGDLRLYVLVQFFPMIAVLLLMALFPSRCTRGGDLVGVVAWYALAKALEHWDGAVYRALGRRVSGHSLKHLAAAVAVYWILRMLKLRRVLS